MAQQVNDPVLSLLWLRSLLWLGFDPWPQEIPHAKGAAKKKKKEGGGVPSTVAGGQLFPTKET